MQNWLKAFAVSEPLGASSSLLSLHHNSGSRHGYRIIRQFPDAVIFHSFHSDVPDLELQKL